MKLQNRDYLKGLTPEEKLAYEKILEEEKLNCPKFARKNLFHKYPKAARHCLNLFPNNYLDINELKETDLLKEKNKNFDNLVNNQKTTERTILNFINHNENYHIIGAILKCGGYRFGHHSAHLFPEFQLGNAKRPDYLLIGESSGGYEFVFVELESVYGRITLQDGNLGDCFNKGIRQVNDWSRWLQANFNQLYAEFINCKSKNQQLSQEFIQYDDSRIHFVVIAGRRNDFNELTYRIGREFESSQKIKLLHYDNLIDFSNSIIGESSY